MTITIQIDRRIWAAISACLMIGGASRSQAQLDDILKGRTLVVLKLYWKNGRLKAELGVGQGKVAHDKRADLKKRVVDRETAREVARFNRKHG